MNKKIPQVSFITVLKNSKRILNNPLPFHKENFEKHGDIFEVSLGFGKSAIFTRDEELIKHMLQDQHRKYQKSPLQTDDLGHYIGRGLLTSNGEYWLKQRRLIQPAFYKKKLENIKTLIVSTIYKELERFKVVGKSLFSYDDGNAMQRLQQITNQVQEDLIKEIRQPYKRWWFKLSGKIKKTESLAKESRDILRDIIDARIASKKEYDDLLDMLLHSKYEDGSNMSMEQLIDEILILFAAGHETTSNALIFTLMLLSKNTLSMMEFFAKVPFTKNCINEAMRLYPPVYFSDRIAMEDNKFKNLEIKKGTTILTSFFEVHRSSKFWNSPETYNPDRFNNIPTKKLSNWFFPFGAGPRMCVGSNMAMYEMLVVISEIVKKFHVKPVFENIEIKPLITLKPLNSELIFEKR